MERVTRHTRLALAALLAAAAALGAARPVAAQDANDMATTYTAEELSTAAASAAAVASAGVPRAGETVTQFVEGPALDTRPIPGDAFPIDQWGNTE